MATTRTTSTLAACSSPPASSQQHSSFDRNERTSPLAAGSAATSPDNRASRALIENVRTWTIHYRSHSGADRARLRRAARLVRPRQQPRRFRS